MWCAQSRATANTAAAVVVVVVVVVVAAAAVCAMGRPTIAAGQPNALLLVPVHAYHPYSVRNDGAVRCVLRVHVDCFGTKNRARTRHRSTTGEIPQSSAFYTPQRAGPQNLPGTVVPWYWYGA